MEIMGGRRPTAVKKEMGAMFAIPWGDMVLTQAMGRGRIDPISSL
jgi:hypothetical protein